MPNRDTKHPRFFKKHFKHGMPIYSDGEILYISGDNEGISKLVFDNIEAIRRVVSCEGLTLFYLPEFVNDCLSSRQYSYYFPDISEAPSFVNYSDTYRRLWVELFPKKPIPAGGAFLYFSWDDTVYYYEVQELDSAAIIDNLRLFSNAVSKIDGDVLFSSFPGISSSDYPDDEKADRGFQYQINIISAEIQERVEKLRVYGVSEAAIKALFQKEQKLSRLVITEDYRIVLPGYNGMEVKLEPLPKAVYFLFLLHPEGLMFKELPCCRDEFMQIYGRVTNRKNDVIAARSIDRVLDPTDNSINEKCSRIREAFISRFDDNLAKEYYITSYYDLKKRISLDRSLVDLGPLKSI